MSLIPSGTPKDKSRLRGRGAINFRTAHQRRMNTRLRLSYITRPLSSRAARFLEITLRLPASFPRGNTYRRMTVGCPDARAALSPSRSTDFRAARDDGGATEASDTARRGAAFAIYSGAKRFREARRNVGWRPPRMDRALEESAARADLFVLREGWRAGFLPSLLRTASAISSSPIVPSSPPRSTLPSPVPRRAVARRPVLTASHLV